VPGLEVGKGGHQAPGCGVGFTRGETKTTEWEKSALGLIKNQAPRIYRNMDKKPRLTAAVLRGLEKCLACTPLVDFLWGRIEWSDVDGYASKKDLHDAMRAREWLDNMTAYREHKKRNR